MSDVTLTRVLNAPRETVFAHLSQHEHMLKWWGPQGVDVVEAQFDLTPGAPWFAVMENGEGRRYKVSGAVREINPPQFLSLSWAWHDDLDARGPESLVSFTLSAEGSQTKLVLFHADLSSDEVAQNHQEGWTSSLSKLLKIFN